MSRKKQSLFNKTYEEIVTEGTGRRITALEMAAKRYKLKYVLSNPKWAGWLAFMIEKLEKVKDRLAEMTEEERAKTVWNIIREAKKEWKNLPEDRKMEYITKAREMFSGYKNLAEKLVKEAEEFEKLYEEVEKVVAAIA